ncbi:hypothetical protein V6Z11_A07G118900 [Gossypium hirsutum]
MSWMYAYSTDLSLFLFWTFLITVKESPSITTLCNPRSLPKRTACKHATASAANPIPWSGGLHSAVIRLKIAQMVYRKERQISILLFETIQSRNTWFLFSTSCLHLGQTSSVMSLLVRRFDSVGR